MAGEVANGGAGEEVYRCEDCTMFNGDSDVDEGEDEIVLQPDGTAMRHFRHRKSWLDGGGNSGGGVWEGSQRGTWSKSDKKLRLVWGDFAPGYRHKGPAPTVFAFVNDMPGFVLPEDAQVAFAMISHPRLGIGAPGNQLEEGLVRLIVDATFEPSEPRGVELRCGQEGTYDHAASQAAGRSVFTPKVRLYARVAEKIFPANNAET